VPCHGTGTAARLSPMPRSPLVEEMMLLMQVQVMQAWYGIAGVGDAGGLRSPRRVCRQCRQGCRRAGSSQLVLLLGDG